MPQAQRTAAAQRDLEDIGFQIAVVDDRLEVAKKILQQLVSQCDLLAKCSTTSGLLIYSPTSARAQFPAPPLARIRAGNATAGAEILVHCVDIG